MKKFMTIAIIAVLALAAGCNPEHPTITPRITEASTRMVHCAYNNVGENILTDMDAAECIGVMGMVIKACQETAAAPPPPTSPDASKSETTEPEKPKPSNDDTRLTLCLLPIEEVAVPEWKKQYNADVSKGDDSKLAGGIKEVLYAAEQEWDMCDNVFRTYLITCLNSSEAARTQIFPTATVNTEDVKKRQRQNDLTYAKALYAAASLKGTVAPDFFCLYECRTAGRHQLVDNLVSLMEEGRLEPKDVAPDLTPAKLATLRNQGVNEFFAFQKNSKDNDLLGSVLVQLCDEVGKKTIGLTEAEIAELKCDDEDDGETPNSERKADENPAPPAQP